MIEDGGGGGVGVDWGLGCVEWGVGGATQGWGWRYIEYYQGAFQCLE